MVSRYNITAAFPKANIFSARDENNHLTGLQRLRILIYRNGFTVRKNLRVSSLWFTDDSLLKVKIRGNLTEYNFSCIYYIKKKAIPLPAVLIFSFLSFSFIVSWCHCSTNNLHTRDFDDSTELKWVFLHRCNVEIKHKWSWKGPCRKQIKEKKEQIVPKRTQQSLCLTFSSPPSIPLSLSHSPKSL